MALLKVTTTATTPCDVAYGWRSTTVGGVRSPGVGVGLPGCTKVTVVELGLPRVAPPPGLLKVRPKVRSGPGTLVFFSGIVTALVVSPEAKLSVPETGV